MIIAELAKEILGIYRKHGWSLERVLLTEGGEGAIGSKVCLDLFDGAEPERSQFDGLLFSRPSKKGMTAYELRHLDPDPFALFDLVGENESPGEKITEMKLKMAEYASKRRPKGN